MASKFGFVKINANFEKLKRDLPPVIGDMGQNFFRSSFEKQGFTDQTFVPWKEVQRRTPGTNAYKYPKKNASDRHKRGILRGLVTSKQRKGDSLKKLVNRSNTKSTFKEILFEVKSKYAAIHNYGEEGMAFGKYPFKMPQRKFMGRSETLLKSIKNKIDSYMKKLH